MLPEEDDEEEEDDDIHEKLELDYQVGEDIKERVSSITFSLQATIH